MSILKTHMNTQEILQLAQWAADETRKMVPYSSNLPDPDRSLKHRELWIELARRKPMTKSEEAFYKEISDWHIDLSSEKERHEFNKLRFFVTSKNKHMSLFEIQKEFSKFKKFQKDSFEEIEISALRALKFGIGNCYETSAYAMILLLEYPEKDIEGLPKIDQKIPIERVAFHEFDHVFLVLNRDTTIPLHDIEKWNDDAIICDPWTKEAYTKKQLFENKTEEEKKFILSMFKDITHETTTNGQPYYIGNQFNPNLHSDYWNSKVKAEKFYRPEKLVTVKNRPFVSEKLPTSEKRGKSTISLKTRESLNTLDKNNLFKQAAINGRYALVKELLSDENASITAKDKDSALLQALEKNQFYMAKLLINHGAQASIENTNGRNAIYFAMEKDCDDLVELLIKNKNLEYLTKNGTNFSLLPLAVKKNRLDYVNKFVENGIMPSYPYWHTTLNLAVEKNYKDLAIKLLSADHSIFELNETLAIAKKQRFVEIEQLINEKIKSKEAIQNENRKKIKQNVATVKGIILLIENHNKRTKSATKIHTYLKNCLKVTYGDINDDVMKEIFKEIMLELGEKQKTTPGVTLFGFGARDDRTALLYKKIYAMAKKHFCNDETINVESAEKKASNS